MKYAEKTTVSQAKSRAEIEDVLTRYGADQFAYGWTGENAMIGFRFRGRSIKFSVPMPGIDDFPTVYRSATGRRLERSDEDRRRLQEQAGRQRWRALALVIKAKPEAVAAGVATFENEFLAHTMLPDGSTFGEWAAEELDELIDAGRMPTFKMLEAGT